jgi:diguanylate cyclase (GGDEF)-like protein
MLAARSKETPQKRHLSPLFAPIIGMRDGKIMGYEGMMHGPWVSASALPAGLDGAGVAHPATREGAHMCRRFVLERFAQLKLPGKLFLKLDLESVLRPDAQHGPTLNHLGGIGFSAERIVVELTGCPRDADYPLLREAVARYRDTGFQIAIGGLGDGISGLRLWSELRPEYVKIDLQFMYDISLDPARLQLVRSIQEVAEQARTALIAEGIDSEAALVLLRDFGIAYGQGGCIAGPSASPSTAPADELVKALLCHGGAYPQRSGFPQHAATALKLLRFVPVVAPETPNNKVYDMFAGDPHLLVVPVVKNGIALGLITRANLVDRFARPYLRELHGKKACTLLMDFQPMVTEHDTSVQALSQAMVDAERHHLFNGFIITDRGQYIGMGTGHDLMREITQMQIRAASYANPLTLLPGNVPINEHIDSLLRSNVLFHACYVDLDHFKPFNDAYGYSKGDDVIHLTGGILTAHCDPERDFVGHIGGDDFMILFRSDDWEARCHAILGAFGAAIAAHFSAEDCARSGYFSEDRRGEKVFYPLVSVSLGAVKAEPGQYHTRHQIAAASAESKKQAKKTAGNSLFIDRRREPQPL